MSVKETSYMKVGASASVTYGDTLSVPVSFGISDAGDAPVDTGISGTVKLSKNANGSNPITTAIILNGKGNLVYPTSGKDLAIGSNSLYVVYDGSDTRKATSQTLTVSVAKRGLTVSVAFAEKNNDGTTNVTISSAELVGALSSDMVTLDSYSSITATSATAGLGVQNVTL